MIDQIERQIEAYLHDNGAYRWPLSGLRRGGPPTHTIHGYSDLRYAVDRVFLPAR